MEVLVSDYTANPRLKNVEDVDNLIFFFWFTAVEETYTWVGGADALLLLVLFSQLFHSRILGNFFKIK